MEEMNLAANAQTGVTEPVAAAQTGEENQTPAAGVQEDTPETFDELIKGKYKAQFDEKMQSAIKSRLKGAKEIESRYAALVPALQLLSQRYGVAEGDAEGLSRAILGEKAQEANPADRLYTDWMQQSEAVKGDYPGFDLRTELGDDRFRTLLKSGLDMRTAYHAVHLDELLPAAMAATARAVEEKLSRRIAAAGVRPLENAMAGHAAAVVKTDVSKFTKSDVDEVARRVARGERVSFG